MNPKFRNTTIESTAFYAHETAAVAYARNAGFAVHEGEETVADRGDMPGVEFVLTHRAGSGYYWSR